MAQVGSKPAPAPPRGASSRGVGRKLGFSVEPMLLLVLVVAAFAVRVWPIWRVHFWDEAVYLQNAEVIYCAKTNYSELDSRPPLLSIFYAGAFLLWHSPYAASLLTALLNALGVLFLYLSGRILMGRAAAGIAALLFAFSPFLVSTGNSLLTDSPAITLILVAFWLLLRGIRDDSTLAFGFAGMVSAMAVLMRFASLPVVALLWFLAFAAKHWRPAAVATILGFAAGFGPYLVWSRLRYRGFLATLRLGWGNVGGSAEPALYYLRNFVQLFNWIAVAGLALFIAGWILRRRWRWLPDNPFALGVGRYRNADLTYAFLWAWIAIVLPYYSAIAHKELRYVLPLAVPIFLLAGRGLSLLVLMPGRAGRSAGMVVLAALMAYTFAPDLRRFREPLVSPFVSEEKQAADFLDQTAKPGTNLYTNFNYPVFGYYTHLKLIRLADYVDTSIFYREFPQNMPADGYVLVYKELDKDPRIDWLESNPHFRRFHEFPSLVIYEYRVNAN